MKFIINNSLLDLKNIKKDIKIYNNYFLFFIENNIGEFFFIQEIIKKNLILFQNFEFIFFFKTLNLNTLIKNFKKFINLLNYGYYIELVIIGLGFKVFKFKVLNILYFELHYSHIIFYKIPNDIIIKVLKKNIVIFGLNEERVKNIGDEIISLKICNIYKGKGIRYLNDVIRLKLGKQK